MLNICLQKVSSVQPRTGQIVSLFWTIFVQNYGEVATVPSIGLFGVDLFGAGRISGLIGAERISGLIGAGRLSGLIWAG